MVKFIHAADIHLDSPLQRIGQYEDAPVELLRTAPRRALRNLVDLALEEQVNFVLVAGDLYDGDWDDVRTGLYMVQQMTRLREAEIPVYVIAGNHDAASHMTKNVPLPKNVHYLSAKKPETRVLEQHGVAIHGQGFATRSVTQNLAVAYPNAIKGLFNIGMLHTSIEGREGHDSYCPCTLDDLRSKEYDYWGLGHVHQRERLLENPYVAFSGNIQGRHIRECGPKGALLVNADDKGSCQVQFRALDVVRWEQINLAADGLQSVGDLQDALDQKLREIRGEYDGMPLALRVELTGQTPLHSRFLANPQKLEADMRAVIINAGGGQVWLEKFKTRTRPPREPDLGSLADDPLGEVERLAEEYMADDALLAVLAGELEALCRKLPHELTEGQDALKLDKSDWLRETIAGIAPMLLERLQRQEDGA
ncbi:MAG: DNA repair exonuclease [Planctomycetes bacterium]|nr:DNA repair exonuclease [Planctomycetota bacterium]